VRRPQTGPHLRIRPRGAAPGTRQARGASGSRTANPTCARLRIMQKNPKEGFFVFVLDTRYVLHLSFYSLPLQDEQASPVTSHPGAKDTRSSSGPGRRLGSRTVRPASRHSWHAGAVTWVVYSSPAGWSSAPAAMTSTSYALRRPSCPWKLPGTLSLWMIRTPTSRCPLISGATSCRAPTGLAAWYPDPEPESPAPWGRLQSLPLS
jgi:hypothetical protein